MGLFGRLRASSNAAKDSKSDASSSTTGSPHVLRRSPSTFLLSASSSSSSGTTQANSPSRADRASGSTVASTRHSRLPWKRDKPPALPPLNRDTTPVTSPARARAPSAAAFVVPTITTHEASPRKLNPPPQSYPSHAVIKPIPPSVSPDGSHTRNASQQTVVSLQSTFTAHSKASDNSGEWKKEGGILGKLGFESDDWNLERNTQPSTSGASRSSSSGRTERDRQREREQQQQQQQQQPVPRQPGRAPGRDHQRETSSSGPDAHPVIPQRSPMRKLQALSSPTLSINTNPAINVRPTSTVSAADTEDTVEEIRASNEQDDDKKAFGWKRGVRKSIDQAPSPPPVTRRPVSHVGGDRPAQVRRPSSSLFHNPFQKSQSRVSLAFDLDSPTVDDGSFQLKAFRHISGASDAGEGYDQYISLVGAAEPTPPVTPNPRHSQDIGSGSPLQAPRPRPPSAAGSVDSGSRVSVAAFRKGIRRPSSSVLLDGADDEDDIPLSLSRAKLGGGGGSEHPILRRDTSALSLTDAPSPPVQSSVSLAPASPTIESPRGPSPSGRNNPDKRHSPHPPSAAKAFVVRGGKSSRSTLDDKIEMRQTPKYSPVPPRRERLPSPIPVSTLDTSPVPNRGASLTTPVNLSSDTISLSSPPLTPTNATGSNAASPHISNRRLSMSPTPPRPAPLRIPEPQVSSVDLKDLKLPPRPSELDDGPLLPPMRPDSQPPSRGSPLLSSLSPVIDENVRRISGLWGGGAASPNSEDSTKEEGFDPAVAAAHASQPNGTRSPDGYLTPEGQLSPSGSNARLSLYDRLSSVTSVVGSTATNVVANASSALNGSERLYIPPLPVSPERNTVQPALLSASPVSDRTASPAPVPPMMDAPPVRPAIVPHSSFGGLRKKAAEKPTAKSKGWDSSSDEDDDRKKTPPAKKPLQIAHPAPKHAPRDRIPSMIATNEPDMEEITSDDEDEPLTQVRSKSRSSLRPSISRSSLRPTLSRPGSRSSMHSTRSIKTSPQPEVVPPLPSSRPGGRSLAPRPASSMTIMSNGTSSTTRPMSTHTVTGASATRPLSTMTLQSSSLTASASKWSLSSADSPKDTSSDETLARSPPVGPPSRSGGKVLRSSVSSDKLRAPPVPILQQPSPRNDAVSTLSAAGETRHTASPASSRSGLTGDSQGPQPMTPRSMEAARRSWAPADGPRPRGQNDGPAASRPATGYGDWTGMPGMPGMPAGFPYPGMDMASAQAAAMMQHQKQQFQLQWMAAAQRHFDDAWERASNVSNAQTIGGMSGPSYGYSYGPSVPSVSAFSGYPGVPQQAFPQGGYPYGFPSGPFPGMGGMPAMMGMPGMGGMPGQMPGQMGMPPGMPGASMYSYAPPAQSVYGGEFGPPVVPFQRDAGPPSPATRRTRRGSGATELGASSQQPADSTRPSAPRPSRTPRPCPTRPRLRPSPATTDPPRAALSPSSRRSSKSTRAA